MVRDTVAHLRAEGQQVFLDAEHFFDGYRANRDYALEVLRTAYDAGAEVDRALRHQRRHAARLGRRRRPRRHRDAPGCGSASTATTTPAARSPTPWPRSTPAPRHVQGMHQRVRRAHRQRRPGLGGRQPRAQAGPAGAAAGPARARPPGSRTRSPRSPTSRPPRGSRTSAPRRSRTRPACTPARSRSTRTSTSTSTRCGVGNDMRLLVSDMAGRASIELKGRELGFDLVRRPGAGHPGHRPGQGAGGRAATRSRPPTRPSSCCWSRRSRARGRRTSTSSRGGSSPRPRPRDGRGGLRGDGEARAPRACATSSTGEGNGPVNALDQALRDGDRPGLPGGREVRADRLQGAHPRPGPRHRRDHPGADRDQRRRVVVGHRRGRRQRDRGVVGRAGRRAHVRAAAPGA